MEIAKDCSASISGQNNPTSSTQYFFDCWTLKKMELRFFETSKTISQSTQQQPKNAKYSAAAPSEPQMPYCIIVKGKVKVKQSRHRPGVAQRVPGS